MENCTADVFVSRQDAAAYPSAEQTDMFGYMIAFAQQLLTGSGDFTTLDPFQVSILVRVVWGALAFVILVCAFIPLSACLCCGNCMRDDVYRLGYPMCGCRGWLPPSIFFALNWGSLVCLAIALPFTVSHLASAVEDWYCVMTAAADDASLLVDDVYDSTTVIIDHVVSTVDWAVVFIDGMLDQISTNTTAINSSIATVSKSMYAGCGNITSSSAYKNLESISSSGSFEPFDCSSLKKIAPAVSQKVVQVDNVIAQARAQVASANASGQAAIANARDEVDDALSDANDQIAQVEDWLTSLTVDIPFSVPFFIPEEGRISVAWLTYDLADKLVDVTLLLCVLPYVSGLFWGFGILLLWLAQCAVSRHQRSSRVSRTRVVTAGVDVTDADIAKSEAAAQPLVSDLRVHNIERAHAMADHRSDTGGRTKCGKGLNSAGCAFGYCGALLLSLIAMVGLVVGPALADIATFYYVVPYKLTDPSTIALIQSVTNYTDEEIRNISGIVDVCVLGAQNSSIVAAAEYVGVDLTALVDQAMSLPPINMSQYGNVTQEVETARVEAASAWSALENDYAFSSADMAAADAAADHCCSYEDLFKLWVSDCSDTDSECYKCQQLSTTECTPNQKCSPTAGTDAAKCNEIAQDARTVMTQANALIAKQQPRFNDVDKFVLKIFLLAGLRCAASLLHSAFAQQLSCCYSTGQHRALRQQSREPTRSVSANCSARGGFNALFSVGRHLLRSLLSIRGAPRNVHGSSWQLRVCDHVPYHFPHVPDLHGQREARCWLPQAGPNTLCGHRRYGAHCHSSRFCRGRQPRGLTGCVSTTLGA